jgi:hypothetical protein
VLVVSGNPWMQCTVLGVWTRNPLGRGDARSKYFDKIWERCYAWRYSASSLKRSKSSVCSTAVSLCWPRSCQIRPATRLRTAKRKKEVIVITCKVGLWPVPTHKQISLLVLGSPISLQPTGWNWKNYELWLSFILSQAHHLYFTNKKIISLFSLLSLKRKVRLMWSPVCLSVRLSVCLCVPPNTFWTNW